MHPPSVSWHIIPVKFSRWNIIWFGKTEPIKVQFFRILSALMKVHPISNAIFETARSGFIQILHHWPVSWKVTPLHFLAQTSCTLDKNSHQNKISGLLSDCVKIHQIPHFIFETTTFHHSSMSWEIFSVLFSWNIIWFLQKEPIKVQNFRLSTAQVRFHQICTLIGSFCWKYIKFQLKK